MSKSTSTSQLHTCSCIRFGVDCGRQTGGTWAPGHDAKAKSLLQSAHRNSEEVVVDGVIMSARQGAELVVPALVPFLYYRKGSLAARFADDDAALKDSAFSAQIKVGRWTYNALVAGSVVTYVTAKGEARTMDVAEAKFVS
jgi:hypothetical protein